MIAQIKTVAVYVEDQEKAVAFYSEKLGFEVRHKTPMGPKADWVKMAPKGAQTYLVLYPKSMMPDWAQRKPSRELGTGLTIRFC